MTAELDRPWVPTQLTPPVTKKTLSMQMAEVLAVAYGENIDNAYALTTTTDNDDSPEGTVAGADWALTFVLRKLAGALPNGAERWPDLVNASAAEIHANLHHAKRRVSPDLVRRALTQAKAEWQAIQAAEPAEPVEPSPVESNTRRPEDDE